VPNLCDSGECESAAAGALSELIGPERESDTRNALHALKLSYVNWVFLHDEHTQPVNAKTRLGLADYNGNKRPIWDAWQTLKRRAYAPTAQ
jgi:hypothetical protein